ncbi:MAG: PQQ-dependent sugar dehydrogenase, partial [Balneolaceae bacterium]
MDETDKTNEVTLKLPDGFRAQVVADSIGPARHIAVNDNGDIYVKLRRSYDDGSIVALRDTSGDGKADIIEKFGVFDDDRGGYHTEAEIHEGHLYVSTHLKVYRYRLTPDQLVPDDMPDTLVIDDHEHGSHEHITKPVSFDNEGHMYVPFGAPNNACQEPKRTPGVPGQDPCPDLEDHGGVWRFDKNAKNQTQDEGYEFSTGIRSVVAMDWNPVDENLYIVMHGRDDLHRLWPNRFTPWENALLPAEEFMRVTEGSDFGWPYCYYDQLQEKKVLAPEYGGDGEITDRCEEFDLPLIGFPGHFAPNDLLFYRGEQFPERYKNGAFIAFHGSTIRNPYSQAGYFVAFVPFDNGEPAGEWEVFANGFAGVDPIVNTGDAIHRPVGLATGPDGSLYITESNNGKVWRITFEGDRETFGEEQLAGMREEKRTANNIRTPHEENDMLQREELLAGEKIYTTYCAPCHQRNGEGAPPRYPPLVGTDWVTGDKQRLISIIINGLDGPIEVNG